MAAAHFVCDKSPSEKSAGRTKAIEVSVTFKGTTDCFFSPCFNSTETETVLLSDTVGFIQKLPTDLIVAFRATLEEIAEADLLLHLIDGSHENAANQKTTVLETLEELGTGEIPILTIYNKIDLLDETALEELKENANPHALFISAKERLGFEALVEGIASGIVQNFKRLSVLLPFSEGKLVSIFHEKGHVETLEHLEEGVSITGLLPIELLSFFEPYLK